MFSRCDAFIEVHALVILKTESVAGEGCYLQRQWVVFFSSILISDRAPEILEDRAPIGLASSVLPWPCFERERGRERSLQQGGRDPERERRRGGEEERRRPSSRLNGSRVPFWAFISFSRKRVVTNILVVCAKRRKQEACTSFYLANPVNASDATCGK